jgi:hypothetical protein
LLPDQEPLIELWKQSWSKHGWTPVVLNTQSANPGSDRFRAAFAQLPSGNIGNYEELCFLRWVAMERQGAGWLSDYDVMNYGYTPDDANAASARWSEPLVVCDGHVPALVYGNRAGYRNAVWDFLSVHVPDVVERANGRPHVSDMVLISKGVLKHWRSVDLLREYGEGDWRECPLIHYAAARMGGRSKHSVIMSERPV